MNKIKIAFISSFVTFGFLAFAKPAFAAVRCETQYGGGEVCVTTGELQINKKVWSPSKQEFVDNLSMTDQLFKTADFVTFKLTVKNIGDNTLTNIKVVDTLPSFLFFTAGSVSEYTIDQLNPGDSEEIEVKTQVVAESQLTVDKICGINTAEATADNDQHDKDTAEVCATKKTLTVSELPKTGFNTPAITFGASLATALVGLVLIKIGKRTA